MRKIASSSVEAEDVTMAGSTGTTIRWLIGRGEAPHFMMRKFEILPGGKIGLHSHPEEHEIYVLAGSGRVFNGEGEEVVAVRGDFLFVPGDEPHGYENLEDEPFVFICVIPKLGD
ncbi:MAG: cupin domain-containing protein [Promethearchaeota archaeon]